jgi:PAS domain S-box-containing protein/putative nucleotidyltransferase with HDIG domain
MDNLKSERDFYRQQCNDLGTPVLRTQREQRRAREEEALRESKEELEAIFNQVRDGIVVLDMTGKIIKINKRITEATGYTEEDIVGKRFKSLKMFTPKSIAKMFFRFSKSLAGIEILPYEVEGYTKTGEKRIAEISGSLLRKRGKAVGVITVMRDITERKRAEEALSESEKRLKIIFDSQQNGILIIDAHSHTIIDVNTYAARIIGLPREDIIGKICHSFICPAEKGQCPVSDLGQAIDQSERILIQTKGNRIPILKSVTRAPINGGELFIESFQDITERKRVGEDLKESFERLRRSLESTVSVLAWAVEMRDPYTAGHQQRVTDLACAIATEMGLSEEQMHGIRVAGLIHDIGKLNIPSEILNKPGQLKEIEYGFFKIHPEVGYDVLKTIEFPWPVAKIVLQHHERMDGSGYPQGLSGAEIILEARILAVADIVEAMATHRPYRPARGIGDALEEILHNKGTFYDLDVVDACLRVFYEKGFKFD